LGWKEKKKRVGGGGGEKIQPRLARLDAVCYIGLVKDEERNKQGENTGKEGGGPYSAFLALECSIKKGKYIEIKGRKNQADSVTYHR